MGRVIEGAVGVSVLAGVGVCEIEPGVGDGEADGVEVEETVGKEVAVLNKALEIVGAEVLVGVNVEGCWEQARGKLKAKNMKIMKTMPDICCLMCMDEL